MRTRILLVDSHPAFLATVSRFLRDQEDIEVVGQAAPGPPAVESTRQLKPDIVLMDIQASIRPGIDAVRQIQREQPGVKIILWSIDRLPARVREVVRPAAQGYPRVSALPSPEEGNHGRGVVDTDSPTATEGMIPDVPIPCPHAHDPCFSPRKQGLPPQESRFFR